ncbi:OmpH family outer membrane protein [Pseudomonadota bacterium]
MLKKLMLAVLFCALPVLAHAEATKIGFVNGARLAEEAPQAIAAGERLTKEFEPRKDEILQLQESLAKQEEAFLKDSAFMSTTEKQKKERALVSGKRELRLAETEFREDLTIRRNEEMAKVWEVLREAIQEYGTKENYDLIMFEGVSYASDKVNVTEKVLTLLKEK